MITKPNNQHTILHLLLGYALYTFATHFLYIFTKVLQFTNLHNCILFGLLSLITIYLGLFVFQKGLSFAMILIALHSTIKFWSYYTWKLTDLARFLLAITLLSIIIYALYKLLKK